MINSITNYLMPYLKKKTVAVILMVILVIIFMVWLMAAYTSGTPNYEAITNVLKVFQTLLPIILEVLT